MTRSSHSPHRSGVIAYDRKRRIPWRTGVAATFVIIVLTVGTLVLCGCAGIVSHKNKPPGSAGLPPNGLYDLTIHIPDIGSVTTRIAAQPTAGGGFKANSRPGAVRQLVPGTKGVLAPWLAPKQFGGGAFLHCRCADGSQVGRAEIRLPIGSFHYDLSSLGATNELRTEKDDLAGFVSLEVAHSSGRSAIDRRALVGQLEQVFRENLFDPSLAESPAVRAYFSRLNELSAVAQDDMEFLFGAFLARKLLPFSHVSLIRELDPGLAGRLSITPQAAPTNSINLTWRGTVGIIRLAAFQQAESAIDGVFDQLKTQPTSGLVLDLRGCRGGDYSCLRVAAHLLSEPAEAGVLFGPKARAMVLSNKFDGFPQVERLASVTELTALLREHGALRGLVRPVADPYVGKVAVLINHGTASAAEPLAALLQAAGRAKLFGDRTAGAMLSSERAHLPNGWILQYPAFDYVTANGTRLEGRGVATDIPCKPGQSLEKALEYLH